MPSKVAHLMFYLFWVFRCKTGLLSPLFGFDSLLGPQLIVSLRLWQDRNPTQRLLTSNKYRMSKVVLEMSSVVFLDYISACCFRTSMVFLYKDTFFFWTFSMMLSNCKKEHKALMRCQLPVGQWCNVTKHQSKCQSDCFVTFTFTPLYFLWKNPTFTLSSGQTKSFNHRYMIFHE